MELTRDYAIVSVLEREDGDGEKSLTLTLQRHVSAKAQRHLGRMYAREARNLARHHLDPEEELEGRVLRCLFQDRVLNYREQANARGVGWVPDMRSVRDFDLAIRSLTRIETAQPAYVTSGKDAADRPVATSNLHLATFEDPPLVTAARITYSFVLDLSEEEYAACRALKHGTIFRVMIEPLPAT